MPITEQEVLDARQALQRKVDGEPGGTQEFLQLLLPHAPFIVAAMAQAAKSGKGNVTYEDVGIKVPVGENESAKGKMTVTEVEPADEEPEKASETDSEEKTATTETSPPETGGTNAAPSGKDSLEK